METVTANPPRQLKKLHYTHEAMVDLIIQEPTATHAELGAVFGYTSGWVARVIASDAFQARLAERKAILVDPAIQQTIRERLTGVAVQSMNIITEKLQSEQSASYAIDALGVAVAALGPRNGR